MSSKPYNKQVFVCHACNWKRELGNTAECRNKMYDHPEYGRVSGVEMANLDVERHNCNTYNNARKRVRHAALRFHRLVGV